MAISSHVPEEILLETNARNPLYFDVWRVNIHTGVARQVLQNDRFTWLHADTHLRLRLAEQRNADGSVTFCVPDGEDTWRPLVEVPPEDETLTRPFRVYETPKAFGPDDAVIYARDSRGRDTAALVAWDLKTGVAHQIGADDRADVAAISVDACTQEVLAWVSEHEKPCIHAMPSGQKTFSLLEGQLGDCCWAVAQSADAQRWVVAHRPGIRPAAYHLLDRETATLTHLFDERPKLRDVQLAHTTTHIVPSRDGLELVCYVTRPVDAGSHMLPLIVLIHGGPWIRDNFVFDAWTELLANRGYSVLRVNFRGSGGFGKSFLNAGDREWGGAMLDDVLDALKWAIEQKLAEPGRIAAMGASFGGYSTLMAMARAPELFACGIDIFGISNLESFLESIPPHWKALKAMWAQRVGEVDTAEGRAFLASRSPLNLADKITGPMLIFQGGADPRVTERESRQMAVSLDTNGVEVTYVLFPNEGHNFFQLSNEQTFFACAEAFLAKHLHGRAEPFGNEIEEAEVVVPCGAMHLAGLASAMKRRLAKTGQVIR